jgi:hypothetical protein
VTVASTWASGIVYDNYATVNGCTFVGWVNNADGERIGAIVCSNAEKGTATGNKFVHIESKSTLCAKTCINGGDGGNTTIQWADITADNYAGYGITAEQYQYMQDYVIAIYDFAQTDGVLTFKLFVGNKVGKWTDYSCYAWDPISNYVSHTYDADTLTMTIDLKGNTESGGLGLASETTFALGIVINDVYYEVYDITVKEDL